MTKHSFLYFGARVGAGLLSTVTLAVLTRLLGTSEYGLYALSVTTATVSATLVFQWLSVATGRFYPAYEAHLGVLAAATSRGFIGAAGFAVLPVTVYAFARRDLSPGLTLAVLISVFALGRYNLHLQLANSKGQPGGYAALSWTKGVVALASSAGLVLAGAGTVGAVAGFAAGHVLAAAVLNPLRGVHALYSVEARELCSRLLRYGLPLVLTFTGTLAVDFADRFLIAWLLGVARVGPYAAAYDLATQTIGAIGNVLSLSAFPAVLAAYERNTEDRRALRSLGQALVSLALPAAVGFAVLAKDIAGLLLGAPFREDAASVMPILAVALWMSGFKSYFLDSAFQLRHATRRLAVVALFMMVVNVALNLLLLRSHGVVGAAWATLLAVLAGTGASLLLGRRHLRLPDVRADLMKALAACLAMALGLRLSPAANGLAGLLAKIAGGGVLYLAAAWVLNVADARARWTRFRARLWSA